MSNLKALSFLVVSLCLLPIIAVCISAISGGLESIISLSETILLKYSINTIILCLIVAIFTAIIGSVSAWLVTVTQFPGRGFFEFALVLPLTYPAYVIAYAYTDLLDHPGAVQTILRDVMDWGPRDYWFPEIRSLEGAAIMLVLVLYPYVYLLARTAFLQQSETTFSVARTLGKSPLQIFFSVSLPIARPAIVGGVLLALMETLADYGTVSYFGVQTFATGIYISWFGLFDQAAASQLALCLLIVALTIAMLEKQQRACQRHFNIGTRTERIKPRKLKGFASACAVLLCGLPVFFGFILPTCLLVSLAIGFEHILLSPRYLVFLKNSLVLASIAAVLTVFASLALSLNGRFTNTMFARISIRIAGIGYAVPGGVIAVGLLFPFAAFDNALDYFMRSNFGIGTGLLVTGSIGLLIAAYMVRFMAVSLNTMEAGLATINPNMEAAARTLGEKPTGLVRRIFLPILRPSVLTAILIVFVDVMKELPATLILRPFNYDTLAVQAHRLASDERLQEAAVPSLVIAAIGLLPVVLLIRSIRR